MSFIEKMRDEHSTPGSRDQLYALWSQWVKDKYQSEPARPVCAVKLAIDAETPPESETEEVQMPDGCRNRGCCFRDKRLMN
jgi:hypothetical protein